MNRHPAHQMAETVMYAAEELRGYMDSGGPFPWELTEDDHLALLPRLERSISALGDGIRGIAEATGDEYARRQLTDNYHRLVQASVGVRLAMSSLDDEADDEPRGEPETAAPAALAAGSFPQPLTEEAASRFDDSAGHYGRCGPSGQGEPQAYPVGGRKCQGKTTCQPDTTRITTARSTRESPASWPL